MTFVPTHARNIAMGMIQRHGGVNGALEVCRQNIRSPHTEEAGKKFWTMVLSILETERGTTASHDSPRV